MLEPIVTTIEVPCGQQQAFKVFLQGMPGWWPLDKRSVSALQGQPARGLQVEARVGGTLVETGHDGTEHLWGTVRAYDPYGYLRLDFHIGMPPENASTVEVRFTALKPGWTRAELTQSNWEAFGDLAEMMRGGYGSSWVLLFEQAYKAACGG